MNYEPFDFNKYKAGRKAVTRGGREVTQLTEFKTKDGFKYAGILDELFQAWHSDGKYYNSGAESDRDLFLLPEVREYWVAVDGNLNVYGCRSEEEADIRVKNNPELKKAKLIIYG